MALENSAPPASIASLWRNMSTTDSVAPVRGARADQVPLFFDRDASLIQFYRRVLDEARDTRHPLLERVKFLAILGSHLNRWTRTGRRGSDARHLMSEADQYLRRHLCPALAAKGIHLGVPGTSQPGRWASLEQLWDISRLERPDLRDPPQYPHVPATLALRADIFEALRAGDILLHHPYESFRPVIQLLEQAAEDPDVLSIAMTLYRTDHDSPVGNALLEALRRGKEVKVFVELNAREDEVNNTRWARVLDHAGANVVCGIAGAKVHAKLAVIARRERTTIRRYLHVSTGNYHAGTSRTYEDLGLLTCNADLCADAAGLLDALLGRSPLCDSQTMTFAPAKLRRRLHDLIDREIAWSHRGEAAHMILKMNALTDRDVIRRLYRASRAGVRVDLIVRGTCCLRPGVPALSDRIRVRSIVGRFLEHSRAWYFRNGGREEVYLTSADIRSRNLERRVEVAVPLTDHSLVRRVRDQVLSLCLADNVNARELSSDGTYVRVSPRPGLPAVSSQSAIRDHDALGGMA